MTPMTLPREPNENPGLNLVMFALRRYLEPGDIVEWCGLMFCSALRVAPVLMPIGVLEGDRVIEGVGLFETSLDVIGAEHILQH